MTPLEQRINNLVELHSHNLELVSVLKDLKQQFCIYTPAFQPPVVWQSINPSASVEYVQAVIQEFLGNSIPIDPDTVMERIEFLDSLDHVELVMRFEDDFGVEIDDHKAEKLLRMTVAEVAEFLKQIRIRDV